MPAEFAGVGFESDDAGGVEIRFFAFIRGRRAGAVVEIGGGVARAPIDQIQSGIVGACHPRRAASELPAIAFPGFVPFFAGAWDYIPAPSQTPGFGVERGEIA